MSTPSSVGIVDLESGEFLFSFRSETSPIWSLAWSSDGLKLALGLSDGGLVVWDLNRVNELLDPAGLASLP